jgi:hypothetical protein
MSVGFEVDRFAASDRTVDGTLVLQIGSELKARLYDNTAAALVLPRVSFARYDAAALSVAITERIHGTQVIVAIPLRSVLQNQAGGSAHFQLPVAGTPSAYPSESYGVDGTVAIVLPSNLVFAGGSDEPTDIGAVTVQAFTSKSLGGVNVIFASNNPSLNAPFGIWISRDPVTILFVYCVALVPLFFAVITGHLWAYRARREEFPILPFIAALGTVIVTALPVRLVLVPPDVVALTRVDLTLGTELMILLVVAALAYWAQIWFRTKS